MAQPISDYKSFFENAKQALHEADALGIEEDRLKEEELELEETIKNENKLLVSSLITYLLFKNFNLFYIL